MSDNLYERSQRRLIGSLLYSSDGSNDILGMVTSEDFDDPAMEAYYKSISNVAKRDEEITAFTVANELEGLGLLSKLGGLQELGMLREEGRKALMEAPSILYADQVKKGSTRKLVSSILEEAKPALKEDSGRALTDVVGNLANSLHGELYKMSNESTTVELADTVDNYPEVLEERKIRSEAHGGEEVGLQGIPTPLKTLDKYTRGWTAEQLITIGARTGIGKALALDTMVVTPDGWKTIGELKIGDKVYGRDGLPTIITNMTEVMRDRPCFEFKLSNRESFIADEEHQWIVVINGSETVKTTLEIRKVLEQGGEVRIRKSEPLQYSDNEYPAVKNSYGFGCLLSVTKAKAIPTDFIQSEVSFRKDLFWGIVDSQEELYPDLVELGNNLGLAIPVGAISTSEVPRASDKSVIVSGVEPVATVPVKCIEVDNHDHSYLIGESMIPTHNSIFAVNSAVAAAASGSSVLFFSLEMSDEELVDRLVSSVTQVSQSKLKTGYVSADDLRKISDQAETIRNMRIQIDTDPHVTIDSIRAKAIQKKQSKDGLDFIIIDYLQLISSTPGHTFGSRQEQVAVLSRSVKLLAKQLQIPIMILVQLNRAVNTEEDQIPTLDNIRESGAIAQDSNIVVLLHRDKEIVSDDEPPKTKIILAKNRNGPADRIITCNSFLSTSTFLEVTAEEYALIATDEELDDLLDDDDLDDNILGEDLSPISSVTEDPLPESLPPDLGAPVEYLGGAEDYFSYDDGIEDHFEEDWDDF